MRVWKGDASAELALTSLLDGISVTLTTSQSSKEVLPNTSKQTCCLFCGTDAEWLAWGPSPELPPSGRVPLLDLRQIVKLPPPLNSEEGRASFRFVAESTTISIEPTVTADQKQGQTNLSNWIKALEWLVETVQTDTPDVGSSEDSTVSMVCSIM
jgi:hypothetical protein